MSTMARSFWRRIDASAISFSATAWLHLLHPDYRSGLLDCLNQTDQ